MMEPARPRLACIGDNTVDVYVDRGVMYPGGNAVNVAAMARRAQIETAYVGCLGQDRYGDLVLGSLQAEGVDVSHCVRDPGHNARALIRHKAGDRVFVGSIPGVRTRFDIGERELDYLRGFDMVHTSIHSDLDDKLDRIASAAAFLSYDFSNRWSVKQRDRLAPMLDAAFISASDLSDPDCESLLQSWATAGVPLVFATRGSRGAIALSVGNYSRQQSIPTKVVDTLAAGDGFIAGVLTALAVQKSVQAALRQGAEFAAAACAVRGAFGHGVPASGEDLMLPGPGGKLIPAKSIEEGNS